MAIKAKMLGRAAVMRRLNHLVPEAEKQLADAQLEAAVDLADAIRPRAPVNDGEYRDSIRGGRLDDNPGAAPVGLRQTKDRNATGVFALFKWRWIEWGTKARFRKDGSSSGVMPAHPHILPTFRAKRKVIRRKMANAVNKAVRKFRGK